MKEVSKRAWIVGIMLISYLSTNAQDLPAIKEAKRLLETDQPKKALAAFNEAIKANPSDASLWYYLGNAQVKTGDLKNAEISFQKGLDLNPKEALNTAGKGQVRMEENNPTEAKTLFDQALAATKSKNPAVLKAVAEGYLMGDKFANEALATLQKGKPGSDPEYFTLLGDAYLKLNDGGKAVSNYENASSADPKSGAGAYKAGLVFLRSKNYEVAEQNFKKSIASDPNYTLAHKELGELYYQMGSKKAPDAVKAYESYLKLTESPEEGEVRYAFFLFMAKDYKKANEIFKKFINKPEVKPVVWKYYAYSLVESGELQQSEEAFNKYFSSVPANEIQAKDYVYYAKMLQKQGKDSLAVESFNKALAMEKDVEVATIVADTEFSKLKRYPRAIEAYELLDSLKATKLGSQELFAFGRAYYFTEQYGKADTTFQRLITLQPNMSVVYVWQARSVAALDPEVNGKIKGLAKPIFEKVIEKGQANPEKSKKDLIEAYSYMGYYHVMNNEISVAKTYFEKVLQLDPKDPKATEFLKEIKKPVKQG